MIEDNTMFGRNPPVPADRRVAAGPGIRGAVLEVMGKPWWQLLGYCAGVYKFRMEETKKAGDTAAYQAAERLTRRFLTFGYQRLETDRGLSIEEAARIFDNEVDYGVLSAADGGETYRPFALDEQRCRDVQAGYVVTFRPSMQS